MDKTGQLNSESSAFKINPFAIAALVIGSVVALFGATSIISNYLSTLACESGKYGLMDCVGLTYFGYGIYSSLIIIGVIVDAWSLKKIRTPLFSKT